MNANLRLCSTQNETVGYIESFRVVSFIDNFLITYSISIFRFFSYLLQLIALTSPL